MRGGIWEGMVDAVPVTPQDTTPAAGKRRGRKKRPAILKENLVGPANLAVLQRHLERLRAAHDHPNRLLHLDNLVVALLYAFYNPILSVESRQHLKIACFQAGFYGGANVGFFINHQDFLSMQIPVRYENQGE